MTQETKTPSQKIRPAWLQILEIGARLLCICAVVAGIISFVYAKTNAKAEENIAQKKRDAMVEIFREKDLSFAELQPGFYSILAENQTPLGYCVESTAGGFGGDLSLMVGFDATGEIKGVSIISHSETPGLGARVDNAEYLAQYQGKSGNLALRKENGEIDGISGATISSRAVLAAVNAATERLQTSGLLLGGDAK